MGAGSITSNVKSDDKKLVVVKTEEGNIETGMKKFGAMVGDEVEVGCGSILNPGTVVGSHTKYLSRCLPREVCSGRKYLQKTAK